MSYQPFKDPNVAALFEAFPCEIREELLKLRELIFDVGNALEAIGSVEESIKWGEPSYATIFGSPVRLGWNKKNPQEYCLYFHCQTTLVSTFRAQFEKELSFVGNRAIVFDKTQDIPEQEVRQCLKLALSYHQKKKKSTRGVI